MAKLSRALSVILALAMVAIAVFGIVLRGRMRCAGFAGDTVTSAELPPPRTSDVMRFATWNIRNFPFDERPQDSDLGYARSTNICDLEAALAGLDADVLGVAEVRDTRRFPPILLRAGGDRRYQVALAKSGGRFGQKVGIAWDDALLELVRGPVQIDEVAHDPALRPALALYLRHRQPTGPDFTVVQLHLAAGPDAHPTRGRQLRALAGWLETWVATVEDRDLILMGDFNTCGRRGGTAEEEITEADEVLEAVGLRRLENLSGCTQYWEGRGPRDGVQQPSLLDLVWVGGFSGLDDGTEALAWLHCARHDCAPFISRPGDEDGTFWDLSDHCPVTFELPLAARR